LSFLILFFVGGAQTPLPLIHPPHLIFGGSVRGKSQNQFDAVLLLRTGSNASQLGFASSLKHINHPITAVLVLIFFPLSVPPEIGPAGRTSGKGV
jgi:hypothetical protein